MRIHVRSLIRGIAIATVMVSVMLAGAGTTLAHPGPRVAQQRVSQTQGTVPYVPTGSDCITINASFARMNTNVARAFGQVINTCGVDLSRAYVSASAYINCVGTPGANGASLMLPNPWSASPPSNTQSFDLSITGQCAICGSDGVNQYPPFTMTITLVARGTEPSFAVDTEVQPSPSQTWTMPNSSAYNPC